MKRTVLVSGASSGIGLAIVKRLLLHGHRVIGLSRHRKRLDDMALNCFSMDLDFTRLADIPIVAKRLQQDFPELDAVVFSAGYGLFGNLEQFSFKQIEELMTVNFTGQAILTRALLPKLKQKTNGNLIYIGSEAALKGSRQGTIYCASKFALRGFAQALREECGKNGIKVSLINPGMVDTPFFEKLNFKPGKCRTQSLQADDVADSVLYILQAGFHCAIDEINLSPLCKAIEFKK